MASQSPQLFNSLCPHPLQDLSSLHGLWGSNQPGRCLHPGCSPTAITPRGYGYTEGGYNSGPHSQQILLSSH